MLERETLTAPRFPREGRWDDDSWGWDGWMDGCIMAPDPPISALPHLRQICGSLIFNNLHQEG